MLNYEGNVAYDLSMFDEKEENNIEQELVVAPKISKQKKLKSLKVRKQEARVTAFKTVRVVGTTAVLLFCVCVLTLARTQLAENTSKLAAVQKDYAIAQSESVRLNMELTSLASLDKVEVYARDVLGMIKQEKSQVEYIDLAQGNKIILADNAKNQGFFGQIKGKVDDLLEYIS